MGRRVLVFLTDSELLEKQAEIIELFYSGDKITLRALAKQFGISKNNITEVLLKYQPRKGTQRIVILLQSKLNDEWGEGDYQLKQESQED